VGQQASIQTELAGGIPSEEPAPGRKLKLNFLADAVKDGVAHVKMEFALDQHAPSGAEFMARLGQPVTLSSRTDGHLLFIICTLTEPKQGEPNLPVVRKKIAPAYPEELKKDRIQGVAVLKLRIDETGKVLKCDKVKADDDRFVAPACEAALKWEFEPGTKDGKPVALDYVITMTFRLQ
jgi:protein TonB